MIVLRVSRFATPVVGVLLDLRVVVLLIDHVNLGPCREIKVIVRPLET